MGRNQSWTVESAIAAGRVYQVKYRRIPNSTRDFEELNDGLPSTDTVKKLFRSLKIYGEAVATGVVLKKDGKLRPCLRCGRSFNSQHKGNRVCQRCKETHRDYHGGGEWMNDTAVTNRAEDLEDFWTAL